MRRTAGAGHERARYRRAADCFLSASTGGTDPKRQFPSRNCRPSTPKACRPQEARSDVHRRQRIGIQASKTSRRRPAGRTEHWGVQVHVSTARASELRHPLIGVPTATKRSSRFNGQRSYDLGFSWDGDQTLPAGGRSTPARAAACVAALDIAARTDATYLPAQAAPPPAYVASGLLPR